MVDERISEKTNVKARHDVNAFNLWDFCKTKGVLASSHVDFKYGRLLNDKAVADICQINWEMSGGYSDHGDCIVNICGTIEVYLACVNCGLSYKQEIKLDRGLVLQLNEKQAENYDESKLQDNHDVVACEKTVVLENWLEDELLLSLPMIPKHSQGCDQASEAQTMHEQVNQADNISQEKVKPFSGLAELINKNNH